MRGRRKQDGGEEQSVWRKRRIMRKGGKKTDDVFLDVLQPPELCIFR